jgi:hypothetical protein
MDESSIENDLKRYFKEIKSLLPVYGGEEKKFIAAIKVDVDEYAAVDPDCNYERIVSAFGTPKAAVMQHIADADEEYLLRRIRTAKFVKIGIVAGIVAVVIAVSAVVAIYYVDYMKGQGSYVDREVIEVTKEK